MEYHLLVCICQLLIPRYKTCDQIRDMASESCFSGCTYLPALCNLLAPRPISRQQRYTQLGYTNKNVSNSVSAAYYQSRTAWSRRITVRCHSNSFTEASAKSFEELYGISEFGLGYLRSDDTGYLCLHAHSWKGLVNYRNTKKEIPYELVRCIKCPTYRMDYKKTLRLTILYPGFYEEGSWP